VTLELVMLLRSSCQKGSRALRRAKDSTGNDARRSVRQAVAVRTLRVVVSQRRLRLVLVAFGLFRTAELATWVALLIWAYDVGGVTAGGIIAVGQLLPAILAAPLGSVLMNRLPHVRALRVGYLLQAATSLMVAAVIFAEAPFWLVTATAAFATSSMTLSRPVHHALMPELAGSLEELTAGNIASTALEGVGNFLGPALAGALLVVVGPPWVFVAMALTSLLSGSLVRNVRIAQNLAPARRSSSYWGDALEGLQAVVKQSSTAALTATVTGLFVVVGILDILAVVLAFDVLATGPAGPGLITSGLGTGALVGAGAAVTMVGRQHLAPAVAVGLTITGAALALTALSPNLLAALALFVLAGTGKATVDVAARTLLQRSVTPHVLARIFGMQEALLMAGTAIGAALAPLLVLWAGPRGAFVATAALLPAVGLLTWPDISRLDRTGPSTVQGIMERPPPRRSTPCSASVRGERPSEVVALVAAGVTGWIRRQDPSRPYQPPASSRSTVMRGRLVRGHDHRRKPVIGTGGEQNKQAMDTTTTMNALHEHRRERLAGSARPLRASLRRSLSRKA
jgi:MFS family permease